jgi:hypothetical protein
MHLDCDDNLSYCMIYGKKERRKKERRKKT